jgi:uncharacterized protein YndB with AHSA1/START domain
VNNTATLPTTLVLQHRFKAPIERVFDAWSDPEIMREFYAPEENMRVTDVQVDFRVGGAYRVAILMPDGDTYVSYGTYREIDRPSRIVCTQQWQEDDPALEKQTQMTLQFASRGTETELTLTHEHFRDAQQRDGHARGWSQCLAKLDARLVELLR